MPQITSCPDCSKKLRVPDDLIGKKVKCPGCTTMFIAEADDTEEESAAPARTPAPSTRGRTDAVSSGPKSGSRRRDEEEDEDRRPPRDEDEDRRSPRRRDDEDEDRRPRSRHDDEDDDRRSRGRRDDDDYDDDRRSRRRYRDDDYDGGPSPREEAEGWRKVRMGLNLVAISGWIGMSIPGIYIIAAGIMLLLGGSAVGAFFSPNPSGALGSMGGIFITICGVTIIVLLLMVGTMALLLTGTGMCMSVPKYYGSSMRGLAIAAFCCFAAAGGLYLVGFITMYISLGMGGFGGGMNITAGLAGLAGHILWMILIRLMCLKLRDDNLAKSVMTNMIVQLVYPFIAGFILVLLALMIGIGVASSGSAGGAATSFGFGVIFIMVLYGVLLVIGLAIYVWYLQTVQKVRDLVDYRLDVM